MHLSIKNLRFLLLLRSMTCNHNLVPNVISFFYGIKLKDYTSKKTYLYVRSNTFKVHTYLSTATTTILMNFNRECKNWYTFPYCTDEMKFGLLTLLNYLISRSRTIKVYFFSESLRGSSFCFKM